MPTDHVELLIERIAVGVQSAEDIRYVRDNLTWVSPPDRFRIGERCVAMDHDQCLQVGDRFYYGLDAVRIRAAVAEAGSGGGDPHAGDGSAAARPVFGGGVVLTAAGLAVLAIALVAHWTPVTAGEWDAVPPGPFEIGFGLIAVGALAMRIADALRAPRGSWRR